MTGKTDGEGVHHDEAAQAAGGNGQGRVEFVQVPAQTVLDADALGDEVLAVLDEQAQLAGGSVQFGEGQVGVAKRG